MQKIDQFRDEYFFLSNFYEIPVTFDGITYQNNEAAFQAQKCMNPEERKQFANLNASEAKKLGRKVQLRPDWENIKIKLMHDIVLAKFEQHSELVNKLLETGDLYLEEGNTWGDRIWGTVDGKGANNLGIILMNIRQHFWKLEQERVFMDERT